MPRPDRRSMRAAAFVLAAVAPLVLPVASLGAQTAAGGRVQPTRSSMPLRDTLRVGVSDSLVRTSNPADLMRIVTDLRAREAKLMEELAATPAENLTTRRRLLSELNQLTREGFSILSVVETRCAAETGPRPSGYIGLNLATEVDSSTGLARFTVVNSVDPGSPSARAGILPGDTLVALAGRDIRGRFPDPPAGAIEPGKRLSLRVARPDGTRDISLTVVDRPENIATSCRQFEGALARLRMPTPRRFILERDQGVEGPRNVTIQGRLQREGSGPEEVRIEFFGPEHLASPTAPLFAGAQFRTLNDSWRNVLKLGPEVQGVLVNTVSVGSPSAQAGLRDGDVVTRVGSTPTTNPMALVNLLIVTEKPEATLQVIRAGEKLTLVMRLPPR